MFLAVDIGNSQTNFATFENGKITKQWSFVTDPSRNKNSYFEALCLPFSQCGLTLTTCTGIGVSSVVPSADTGWSDFCRTYFKKMPQFIDHQMNLGFSLNVDTPSEVGADRLANSAYAVKYLSLPAIVIDIGTATTFDIISDRPSYEGGAILPGVKLALRALNDKTSKLPLVDVGFTKRVIGKNTVECIQGGVMWGYCDMIDGLIERTEKELGKTCERVLTGGYSHLFQSKLRNELSIDPQLTLKGIWLLTGSGTSFL